MALKPNGFEMSPECCSDDKRRVGGVRGVEGLEEENRSPRRLFPESLRGPPGVQRTKSGRNNNCKSAAEGCQFRNATIGARL